MEAVNAAPESTRSSSSTTISVSNELTVHNRHVISGGSASFKSSIKGPAAYDYKFAPLTSEDLTNMDLPFARTIVYLHRPNQAQHIITISNTKEYFEK